LARRKQNRTNLEGQRRKGLFYWGKNKQTYKEKEAPMPGKIIFLLEKGDLRGTSGKKKGCPGIEKGKKQSKGKGLGNGRIGGTKPQGGRGMHNTPRRGGEGGRKCWKGPEKGKTCRGGKEGNRGNAQRAGEYVENKWDSTVWGHGEGGKRETGKELVCAKGSGNPQEQGEHD